LSHRDNPKVALRFRVFLITNFQNGAGGSRPEAIVFGRVSALVSKWDQKAEERILWQGGDGAKGEV